MENNYPKDYFRLVNADEKRIFDKELKTKQLSYFQDAMVRFGRNKSNVIATFILAVLIILSIIVPILTPEDLYTKNNSSLTLLPPRVPILENFGILDGTKFVKNVTVDRTTISDETGLGIPDSINYDPEFIDMDTLENNVLIGAVVDPDYVGGTNEITIADGKYSYVVAAKEYISLSSSENLYVDINEIYGDGTLEFYIVKTVATQDKTVTDPETEETTTYKIISTVVGDVDVTWDNTAYVELVGTATSSGINLIDVTKSYYGLLAIRYVVDTPAEGTSSYVSLNSVYTTLGDENADTLKEYTGFSLANFSQVSLDSTVENGTFLRKNAERLVASFVYDVYGALFNDKFARIGGVEYNRILSENPGMEESIRMSATEDRAWTFADGYPITEVITYTERTETIDGEVQVFRTYDLMLDGKYALGFDEIPYFLFGTDTVGKDLFSLIWLGLRTSLLLGFLAALTNIFFGIIWGSISGYYGGQVDTLMERFTDIWGSFPQITMISIISVIIGPGFLALYIFMVYDGWIGAAKITRLQFYRYRGREYVLAARTMGASDRRIIFKHILPNALGTIVTRVILSIPAVIFLEVNLSYLGFGIGVGQTFTIGPVELTGTSIGVILSGGQSQILSGNLWLIIYPTMIVSILMITFNMFGNALRDALNPQLRGSN